MHAYAGVQQHLIIVNTAQAPSVKPLLFHALRNAHCKHCRTFIIQTKTESMTS